MVQLIVFLIVWKKSIQSGAIVGMWRWLSLYFFLAALFIDGHWFYHFENTYFYLFDKKVPSWFHLLTQFANLGN
jgi:Na+(H+)/acetate symporter ActP